MNDTAYPVSTENGLLAGLSAVRLGAFRFDCPVILAPMSGVTDLPFRRLAARFGADMVVTEMVASEALGTGNAEMALRLAGEGMSPHVVQLAGREPGWMAEAARMAQAQGADIIDINMGCPAKRVTGGLSGAALMRDLDLATSLVRAVVGAVSVPVTVKMRLGWDRSSLNAPDLARRVEGEGAAMITVHGRTRDQFYNGSADWAAIAAVRDAITVPLVANGDIGGLDDVTAARAASRADGIMIGRAAQGQPWLLGQIAARLKGQARAAPEGAARTAIIAEHYEAMLAHYGREVGLRAARKHLAWYAEAGGVADPDPVLRADLMTTTDTSRALRLIERIFGTAEPLEKAA